MSDSKQVSGECFRVMTYNIQSGYGMDRQFDMDRLLSAIGRISPDISGLNEVGYCNDYSHRRNITDELRARFRVSSLFAQAIPRRNEDQSMGGYGVAAFSRFPLYIVEQFRLPVPLEYEQRTCLIVRVDCGHPFYFAVTHLPWEPGEKMDQVRCDCLQAIESRLSSGKYYPAVLTGDFNVGIDSSPVEYLRRNWTLCNDSCSQNTFPADHPDTIIDYIAFYPRNAFRLHSCEVLEEAEASDHRPVLAELEIL